MQSPPTTADGTWLADCEQACFTKGVDLATALDFPGQTPLDVQTMTAMTETLWRKAQRLSPVLVHVISTLQLRLPQWQSDHQAALWAPSWQRVPDIGAAWSVVSDAQLALAELDRCVEVQDPGRLACIVNWTLQLATLCSLHERDLATVPRLIVVNST